MDLCNLKGYILPKMNGWNLKMMASKRESPLPKRFIFRWVELKVMACLNYRSFYDSGDPRYSFTNFLQGASFPQDSIKVGGSPNHLKHMNQHGNLPQEVKLKSIWNHHLYSIIFKVVHSLKLTDIVIVHKNRPSQKETRINNHPFSGAMFVSEGIQFFTFLYFLCFIESYLCGFSHPLRLATKMIKYIKYCMIVLRRKDFKLKHSLSSVAW